MIKAPYNFIPLSEQVVFPEWGDKISHDVPFSDGISGTIKVRLTAESPIFVRNGHKREEQGKENTDYATFSRIGDRFFLPGTTVKGAIRNVLEILSFGKMDVDRNARFAQREWENGKLYPLKKEVLDSNIRCGWLREKSGGGYEIIDCRSPYRIGHKEIDTYIGNNVFEREFSKKSNQILDRNLIKARTIDREEIDPKTAYYKYRLIEKISSIDALENQTFSFTSKSRVSVDPDGDIHGTIVLTGQPDMWTYPRTNNAGKYYEFVFRDPDNKSTRYALSEEEFEQYKFIYTDSPDWKYLNEKMLHRTGIPVFFRCDEKAGKIRDWGLALLYRLQYEHTPYETLPEDHRKESHDMAECIFGYTGKTESLKGRVQFCPFMSDNAKVDSRPCRLVLSGPKASYYPIYIDQQKRGKDGEMNGANQYLTYNDGRPKGWKRYLQRKGTWEKKTGSDDMDTILHPLLPGAVFEGKIRFHNLRPEELGALLSALTFHGNAGECRHQIGMAKPYGYGKVKLDIVDIEEIDFVSVGSVENGGLLDAKGYMAVFEKYMNDELHRPWLESAAVRELLTIAGYDVPNNEEFDYMTLDMEGHNEFNDAKGGKIKKGESEFPCLYLQKYSELIKKQYNVSSLTDLSSEALQLMTEQRGAHQSERKKRESEAILRLKALEEEKKRKELERQEEELRLAKEREDAEKKAKKAEKAAEGLSFLEEKYEFGPNAGKYKIDEFKKARPQITNYLEKTINSERVPEDQWPLLEKCLLRLAKYPSRDEKKKKLWSTRTSPLWSFIEKITSKEFADRLFEEVQKQAKDVKRDRQ